MHKVTCTIQHMVHILGWLNKPDIYMGSCRITGDCDDLLEKSCDFELHKEKTNKMGRLQLSKSDINVDHLLCMLHHLEPRVLELYEGTLNPQIGVENSHFVRIRNYITTCAILKFVCIIII